MVKMIKHTDSPEETEERAACSQLAFTEPCVPVTTLSAGPVLNHSRPWVSAGERLQDPLRIPESADAQVL